MSKFWQTYGVHTISYLLGALPVVQALAPTLIPGYGVAIAAAAGVGLTIVHNVQTANASGAPVSVSPTVKSLLLPLVCLTLGLAAASGITACKTAPTANQQAAIAVGVDLAVGAAVQQGSSDVRVWQARALQFETAAKSIKAVNDAGATSLATLAADLQPIIAKLGPADVLAANALIAALTPYLQDQVAKNPTVATTQAAVDVVLSDVIAACAAYTGQ